MSVGNDGFTNCNYVCNPENDMPWSCTNYCPGYEFTTLAPTLLTTAESVHATSTESGDVQTHRMACLCVGAVVLTIAVIICCLNKKRICACIKDCRDKPLQLQTQVHTSATDAEADSVRHDTGEDNTLLSIQSENGGSGDAPENSSDIGGFI